jgi:hypothetical protein
VIFLLSFLKLTEYLLKVLIGAPIRTLLNTYCRVLVGALIRNLLNTGTYRRVLVGAPIRTLLNTYRRVLDGAPIRNLLNTCCRVLVGAPEAETEQRRWGVHRPGAVFRSYTHFINERKTNPSDVSQ